MDPKLSVLWEKLKNDPSLAKKLGLSDLLEVDEEGEKRKTLPSNSPVRTRKFKKTASGTVEAKKSSHKNMAPKTAERTVEVEAMGTQPPSCSEDLTLDEGLDDLSSEHSTEENPLDEMEQIINDEENDSDADSKIESDSSFNELEILGASNEPVWNPPKNALEFYLKIANLELGKQVVKDLAANFKSSDEIDSHFTPPKFPEPFWAAVQSSPPDSLKLKSIFSVQETLFLSLKPLLEALEESPKHLKEKISQSIQLIASTNLSLNRFRRATIAPYLKREVKKNLMSLPVKHDAFFGEDFNKVSETLMKTQASVEKFLVPQSKPHHFRSVPNFDQNRASTSYGPHRGQKFRGSFRSRGRRFPYNSGKSFRKPQYGHKRPNFSGAKPQ